ncbi:Mov34/MPN/PAD-1 family protein, partial [bacterium]|nr:Mov34/MPN/PAD-1 family protein [candidate division CSSED10-310 bacterium]
SESPLQRSDSFQLLGVRPSIKDIEIYPIPGDQRFCPLKIFCANSVYRRIFRHAVTGVTRDEYNGALEVKGALIGIVLRESYPIVAITDIMEFPISEEDRNDQCSFGAVEDELIRRFLSNKGKSLSVIGFYHSHPDHPVFFSSFDAQMHNRRCRAEWKIGIVVQPREKRMGFFLKQPLNNLPLQTFISGQKPDFILDLDDDGNPASTTKQLDITAEKSNHIEMNNISQTENHSFGSTSNENHSENDINSTQTMSTRKHLTNGNPQHTHKKWKRVGIILLVVSLIVLTSLIIFFLKPKELTVIPSILSKDVYISGTQDQGYQLDLKLNEKIESTAKVHNINQLICHVFQKKTSRVKENVPDENSYHEILSQIWNINQSRKMELPIKQSIPGWQYRIVLEEPNFGLESDPAHTIHGNDVDLDSDEDGLLDSEEYYGRYSAEYDDYMVWFTSKYPMQKLLTDPWNKDTDGDGVQDSEEMLGKTLKDLNGSQFTNPMIADVKVMSK